MKKITALSIVSAVVMAFGLFTFNSCSKDSCKDTTCVHGTVQSVLSVCGCNCNTGYTGTKCDSLLDPCASTTCLNGGTTVPSGQSCSCSCPTGTYGANCGNTFASLFLGASNSAATWVITNETANGTAVNYSNPNEVISAVSGQYNKIAISNFFGAGTSSSNNLTITDSTGTLTSGTDTITFVNSGTTFKIHTFAGTLNAAKTIVNYTYRINDGSTTETATGTLVKQ